MRTLKFILIGFVAISTSLCYRGLRLTKADPTDDFSFYLSHAPEIENYRLMPERRVEQILADHLDLFPKSQTPQLAKHLVNLCKRYRFDPAFILSLINVESHFKVKAHSSVGAVGLMQIMPATASHLAGEWRTELRRRAVPFEKALYDPYLNMSLGVAYLAWLRDHYRGMPPYYLVAAYNIGPSKLDELRSRKDFKPVKTRDYFEAIRRGVPGFRFYRRPA